MKRKLITLLLGAMLICLTFGLTACDDLGGIFTPKAPACTLELIIDGEVYERIETKGEDYIYLPQPTKEGYSYRGWRYNGVNYWSVYISELGVEKDDVLRLEVQWEINTYSISLKSENTYLNSTNGSGNYEYNSSVTITTADALGCDFVGWYDEEELLSTEKEYTFNMPATDVTYTAKWKAKDEMANFEFKSSDTTCVITGVKDNATNLVIPNYVTGFDNLAFRDCTSIKSVKFLNDITNMFNGMFSNCTSLESVEIPNTVTSIGSGVFEHCSALINIEIPNSVTSIGNSAFGWCSSLISIDIPNSVTSMGEGVFTSCTSLEYVKLPNGITSIGLGMFMWCTSLDAIQIPNSVNSIGHSAFTRCSANIVWGNNPSITRIEEGSFDYYEGKTLRIPSSVKIIDDYAFRFGLIERIIIPNGVTSIGVEAFAYSEHLKTIEIPSSVTSIGNRTFYMCTNLCSVTISNGIQTLSDEMFFGCYSLTSIVIPNSVTSIGDSAFTWCYNLIEVINKSSLNIVAGNYDNGGVAEFAKQVLKEEPTVSNFIYKNDFIFYDCITYYLVGYTGSSTEITLPNSINGSNYEIHEGAFAWNKKLTKITIPGSVTAIAKFAFQGCSALTNVIIKEGVEIICDAVFNGCTALESVEIPKSVWCIGSCFAWDSSIIVNYNGTIAEWNAIEKYGFEDYNFTVYCTDGEISKE